jgi:aromatic ring-cleaving dioxygenase
MREFDENVGGQSRCAKRHDSYPLAVPELRIYRFWDKPIGPHPVAMFEVNLFTPAQFGAFIPWLAIWRGPLSVLVHPNTVEEGIEEWVKELRNHTQRAIWLGERIPIDTSLFFYQMALQ